MRVIVVGERANRPTWRPRGWPDVRPGRYWRLMLRLGAFHGRSSRAKLESLGLGDADAVNLLPPDPQGVKWDRAAAELVMSRWLHLLRGYDLCALAGVRVARAIGLRGRLEDLAGRATSVCGVRAVVIPHPSGLSRFWNDGQAVSSLHSELDRLLMTTGGPHAQDTRVDERRVRAPRRGVR